jgi:tRNA (uracil-5-)-methyltransferase
MTRCQSKDKGFRGKPLGSLKLTFALKITQYRSIDTFKRGATLLLRDSLDTSRPLQLSSASPSHDTETTEKHVCVTDYKATVRERIGEKFFEFPAGSFFQNNNSVLLPLVEYVRDAIFTPTMVESDTPTHLVDTYCGAGFFALNLAPHFSVVTGVEISAESIQSARHNAQLNSLPPPPGSEVGNGIKTQSVTFTAGKSESIFESVSSFPPDKTVVVIDPPRKGCDRAFLDQLVRFRPKKLVYVSCNVHTQARDVGDLLRLMEETKKQGKEGTYVIESLRGFDLFPQTAHVESVAVLTLT